jgi:hypothetical protein
LINKRERNPKATINNGPSRETDNMENTRHRAQTNKNTKCSRIFYSPLAIKLEITK